MIAEDNNIPIKRKRGRPRIYPLQSPDPKVQRQSALCPSISSSSAANKKEKVARNNRNRVLLRGPSRRISNNKRINESSKRKCGKDQEYIKNENVQKHMMRCNAQILAVTPYLAEQGLTEYIDLLPLFSINDSKSHQVNTSLADTTISYETHGPENTTSIPSEHCTSLIPGLDVFKFHDPRLHDEEMSIMDQLRFTGFAKTVQRINTTVDSPNFNFTMLCSTLDKAIDWVKSRSKNTQFDFIPSREGSDFGSNREEVQTDDILWDITNDDALLSNFVDYYVNDWHLPVPEYSVQLYSSLKDQVDKARHLHHVFQRVSLLLTLHLNIVCPRYLPYGERCIMIDCTFLSIRILDVVTWNIFNTETEIQMFLQRVVEAMNAPKQTFSILFYSFLRSLYTEKLEFVKQNASNVITCLEEFFAASKTDTSFAEQKSPKDEGSAPTDDLVPLCSINQLKRESGLHCTETENETANSGRSRKPAPCSFPLEQSTTINHTREHPCGENWIVEHTTTEEQVEEDRDAKCVATNNRTAEAIPVAPSVTENPSLSNSGTDCCIEEHTTAKTKVKDDFIETALSMRDSQEDGGGLTCCNVTVGLKMTGVTHIHDAGKTELPVKDCFHPSDVKEPRIASTKRSHNSISVVNRELRLMRGVDRHRKQTLHYNFNEKPKELMTRLISRRQPVILRTNYTGRIQDEDILGLLSKTLDMHTFSRKYPITCPSF